MIIALFRKLFQSVPNQLIYHYVCFETIHCVWYVYKAVVIFPDSTIPTRLFPSSPFSNSFLLNNSLSIYIYSMIIPIALRYYYITTNKSISSLSNINEVITKSKKILCWEKIIQKPNCLTKMTSSTSKSHTNI